MTRNVLSAMLLLAAGAILGAALTVAISPAPAQAQQAGAPGQYKVVASESFFVLWDTLSGEAWVLMAREGDWHPALLPLKRLKTEADIQSYRARRDALQ